MLRFPSPGSIRAISSDQTGRSLLIRGRKAEVILHVSTDLWSTAERIRDDFKLQSVRESGSGTEELNEFELFLTFIRHTMLYVPMDCASLPTKPLLKQLFLTLHNKYLEDLDPHSCIKNKLESMDIQDALRVYYEALVVLKRDPGFGTVFTRAKSALLQEVAAGRAKLLAVFGGQGNTENLLQELVDLDYIYQPLCRPFLKTVAHSLLAAADNPIAKEYMSKGFDVVRWIDDPESRPPKEYLFSAAVSLPLVGLIQLLNYYITFQVLELSPEQMGRSFVGTTGHSQGIISAAVIALSSTEDEFTANTTKALQLLFWIGLRSQQAYPETTLNPKILADSVANGEGVPTPMLSVTNLTLSDLQTQVDVSNRFLSENDKIEIALLNGPRAYVFSGPPKSLYGLNMLLRKLKASSTMDQTKIPFSERKLKFTTRFLPISSPFHCSYLRPAVDAILDDVASRDLGLHGRIFHIPVLSTDSGAPIDPQDNLIKSLVELICVKKINWSRSLQTLPSTHILDFGPGHTSGIGALTHKNIDGSGVQIVLAGTIESPVYHLQSKRHLFGSQMTSVRYAANWALKYRPRLVKNEADGQIYVDTKFSRLLGRQPVMVAGMTPCTADGDFVAAIINAGYHVELAGGSHYNEKALREKIDQIIAKVAPGQGITLNVLFINQRQWGFQFPLTQVLREEGVPVEGFTVAAGVPSLEVANEIIASLRQSGIRHISFKPGSLEGIMQVVTIAKHNKDCPVILQWTGGRAGGHHSFEDFHQPILDTYSAIRSCENICLVGGSGFGDGDETFPYLDGTWSLRYDYPAMPFDGVLFGSRMLVAKESKTSKSVKETIVAAAGVEVERDWVKSYKGAVGGVVTVISELGEPIHKIATRGVMLWKELDETVFNLPREKRLSYLLANKKRLIERLNTDSHKVWFGKKEQGGETAELAEMTYNETLVRLGELLYVREQKRWIDKSYRKLFFDFLQRVEERLTKVPGPSCIPSEIDLELNPSIDPLDFLGHLDVDANSFDRSQLMSSEDCLYFVALCSRPGQKPVPFVPIFDENFETWFKKDSLWQAEDVDAVFGQDPQRTCILQGPVAVRHSKIADEPVKQILDSIVTCHVQSILKTYYGDSLGNVESVVWFGESVGIQENMALQMETVSESVEGGNEPVRTFTLNPEQSVLPADNDWYRLIGGGSRTWLTAMLFCDHVLQGRKIVKNTIRTLFRPRSGLSYRVDYSGGLDGVPRKVSVRDSADRDFAAATIEGNVIVIDVYCRGSAGSPALKLLLAYDPRNSTYPLQEDMEGRNRRLKEFYWQVWFPDEGPEEFCKAYQVDPLQAVFHSSESVDPKAISKFCRIVGNYAGAYSEMRSSPRIAPMDFAIVLAWKSVIRCLFPEKIDGDLLKLVHLSNTISYIGDCQALTAGDLIKSEAQVTSLKWTSAGKIVEVEAICHRKQLPVLSVVSRFLFRGKFNNHGLYFEKGRDMEKKLIVKSPEELAKLMSKPWIQWVSHKSIDSIRVGSKLLFKLNFFHQHSDANNIIDVIECKGQVFLKTDTKEYSLVGAVDLVSSKRMRENPVLNYLDRHSYPLDVPTLFEGDGLAITRDSEVGVDMNITTSSTNQTYSDVSGDHNPIHTNPFIADLTALPGTITHGMWTSAAVRALVETYAADNQPLRVRKYDVSFSEMVLPKDKLQTRLYHVGMKNGRKLIKIETFNQQGVKVLNGFAEVDQPRTAFVFTGQGSQEVGMGMDLYATSPVAQKIWNQADDHFLRKYGFSILDIVRNNPKTLTVYFGGPRGQEIKSNYRSMTYETVSNEDTRSAATKSVALFPQIQEDTSSLKFASPHGLLYATQFTQPALTLMEKVAYEDMKHKGLAGPGCAFAGHSLGEYAALASVGDVLSIETLCDIVFYRGLTMQVAVERDVLGRSDYGMVAVNPSRVGPSFDDRALRRLVPRIAEITGKLLEIVNYNVENWQYVVAGSLIALDTLTNCLNYIASKKLNLKQLLEDFGVEKIEEQVSLIIQKCFAASAEKQDLLKFLPLERGIATIPLSGIDVPFHSSFLLPGVPSFRKCLERKINSMCIDVSILRRSYIPNLTGVPFDTTLDYIKLILRNCDSQVLQKLAESWNEEEYFNAAKVQELARVILIELLAFQFASPVRWIETQDVLLKSFAIERLIEIGPAPVLTGMAERTLKIKYQEYDDALNQNRSLWSYSKNKSEIYYESHRVSAVPESSQLLGREAKAKENTPSPTHNGDNVTPSKATLQRSPATPTKRYEELPLEAEEFVRILVALKTKKTLEDVPGSKSIKDLSGGKSTLQNEILADLQKEFGDGVPDRSEELSLKDLSAHIQPVFTKTLGRHASTLIAKLLSSKMPAGFTLATARDLLSREFGLEVKAADQIMLYSLLAEPSSRLTNEDGAKAWLREVASKFFSLHGVELPASESSHGETEGGALVSSVELEKIKIKNKRFIKQQIDLFAAYVEQNLFEFNSIAGNKAGQIVALQQDLDLWLAEHGSVYFEGVKPMFSWIKTRKYDSSWNWARQDVFMLYYDIIFGRLVNVDRDVTAKCLHVMNRSSQDLVDFMEYHIFKSPEMLNSEESAAAYTLTRKYGATLIDQVKESLNRAPVYKDVSVHTRPQVEISFDGSIEYNEIRRNGVSSFEAYVREMVSGSAKLAPTESDGKRMPYLYVRDRSEKDPSRWEYQASKTDLYLSVLTDMAVNGVSYEGKTALLTGCGKGSIGCEILKGLLSGGAKVVVTTSSFHRSTVDFFRSIYECHGAKSSCLIIAPFNQGSVQDVEALIDYIYSRDGTKGLGWDLDYVVPFAAISENGQELSELDSKSELAHRIMLVNVLRMMGAIARAKKTLRIETRPAQVVLPLSPNHGVFGGDGLYSESKIGLETLLNRWHSENWKDYLTVTGAVIGWTRGTGLMNGNNLIAELMEREGLRTFSPNEMAFNILGLMHPRMVRVSEAGPVYGDLNGGLDLIPNLSEFTREMRSSITNRAQIKRALAQERAIESSLDVHQVEKTSIVKPRANSTFAYPKLQDFEHLPGNGMLKDLLDLSRVVVVTGFGEVGPWGNSRTRWEMEADGKFSLEGCIEMAWMMGMIKYETRADAKGKFYTGWVDAKSKEPVQDYEIKQKYEEQILKHAGIRFIEPELFKGYDPARKTFCQEVVIDYDMAPIEVSREEAEQFKLLHGEKTEIYENSNGNWNVKLKRGSAIYIPKALRFDRLVAGQIPTGWDAVRYGVPKDIVGQVDPITLYVLVSTVEALVSAGITDPYEFYQYVHLSEVGNTSGGGEGGMLSNQKIFKSRFLDKPVPADILQESFINTMPAWVNLLLLSSSGPIKTPVGACATAVESVEIGVETILSGKARVVIVGGYDDFQEESSFEFASMQATSNAVDEIAKGRQPDEMSRPTATSRSGFMESQGAGIEVLMTAELALEMGCPIYGIIALTNTATDKEGRSIPAPGQGILTTARSLRPKKFKPRILDLQYRHERLMQALLDVDKWLAEEIRSLEAEALQIEDSGDRRDFVASRTKDIEIEGARRVGSEKLMWGMEFWKQDPRISPIEGALAVFGLTIDDVGVASFHGTGTKANDLNESEVVNKQLVHLERTRGNLLPAIFQKHLTGHPKGAAAAWMLNGVLQVLNTGIIPGNRNADNIDEKLCEYNYLLYPSRTIHTTGLRAGIIKSFGFGQVGGEVLVIHPDYLLRALGKTQLESYGERRGRREAKTYRYLHDALIGISPLVRVKEEPPYSADIESKVYLSPVARAGFDPAKNSWAFTSGSVSEAEERALCDPSSDSLQTVLQTMVASNADGAAGVGVDVQVIGEVNVDSETFLERNFTARERTHCQAQPDPRSSFSGRWAGKEAVLKALCNSLGEVRPAWLMGSGAHLKDIEIVASLNGSPRVELHGELSGLADLAGPAAARGDRKIALSISHSGRYAVAVAIVREK